MPKALSVQVQPDRARSLDMARVTVLCERLAQTAPLVKAHHFDSGSDATDYFNFTFATDHLGDLWHLVQKTLYEDQEIGGAMRDASMAMCEGSRGWDDYLLLYHFDPEEPCDGL